MQSSVFSHSHSHLEQTTRRAVTHDVEGRQSGAEAAQGVRPPLQTILMPLKVFTPASFK